MRTALLLTALVLLTLPALAATPADWSREHPEQLEADHLFSASALLVDGQTGEVLFEKNPDARMYPASTTKIMTLLLGLESGIPLDEEITIPEAAGKIPEGSSVVPVRPGEKMPYRDLLYGFMMRSGNDGANAIAVLTAGSVSAFVERMNQRAVELGCGDTHFVNAHGYHDDDHYSTATDLAKIALAAMQNEDFRQIVATAQYTMQPTSRRDALEIVTRNELIIPDSKYYYPDACGIKTGFHSKAGQCLVGAAERNGQLLVSVALNSDGKDETLKWYDTARLFEYGYTRYRLCPLSELLALPTDGALSVQVPGAAADDPEGGVLSLRVQSVSDPEATVAVLNRDGAAAETLERLLRSADVKLREDLSAPIQEGDAVGSLALALPGGEQVTASLTASRAVGAEAIQIPGAAPETQAPVPAAPTSSGGGRGAAIWISALAAVALLAAVIAALALWYQAKKRAERRRRARQRRLAQARRAQSTRMSAPGAPARAPQPARNSASGAGKSAGQGVPLRRNPAR